MFLAYLWNALSSALRSVTKKTMRTKQENQEHFPLHHFQQTLEVSSGKRLKVKINDNRSTMLSVRWEPDYTRVSLHRMFLQAPGNVMEALACYLKGEEKSLSPSIKQFIEENIRHVDYSRTLDRKRLFAQGKVYDLAQLFTELNEEYFDKRLQLLITWFIQPKAKVRSKVNLGLYQDTLRLIKINSILDSREVPRVVLKFVVYHEMLHAVSPPYVDEQGTNRIHSKEFKLLERRFKQYEEAKQWIRTHRGMLFEEIE